MSNLQVLGRRCPVMGKALTVASCNNANVTLSGAFGGARAYHSRSPRANLHTTGSKKANTVEVESLRRREPGMLSGFGT